VSTIFDTVWGGKKKKNRLSFKVSRSFRSSMEGLRCERTGCAGTNVVRRLETHLLAMVVKVDEYSHGDLISDRNLMIGN
jgi:hypothetical protein